MQHLIRRKVNLASPSLSIRHTYDVPTYSRCRIMPRSSLDWTLPESVTYIFGSLLLEHAL